MDMWNEPEPAGDELAEGEAMSDSELLSILGQHEANAIGFDPGGDDEISAQQQQALNYYYRIMDDVPAQEGSSSVTDGTVQVVIDNALAAVLKPFVSSDETVRFAPRGPEDIATADQATEYINYVFNYDNPGFLILHDWIKDGLLTKMGVVKAWWEDKPRMDAQEVPITDEVQAQYIRQQPDYLGEQDGVALIGREVNDGRVKIVNVPPEEFRVSAQSRSLDDAPYLAHVPLNVTRSDLIEMGFDPEVIEALPGDSEEDNELRDARYRDENISDYRVTAPHRSQDRLALRDEYIKLDYDGDGIAELRRVLRVGDTVLLNEPVDAHPFAAWCPIPMPHKLIGLSLADLVIELQKINTVLWRQMLDNLYKSNNPRPVVGEGAINSDGSTHDSLADNAPGAAIEVRDVSQFRFDAVPFTAGSSMPMLEMVGNMIEERTGIGRAGQGLDTNALRKAGQTTATEMALIAGGKNARVEMIARIFAETGVKQLFRLLFSLVTKHQPQERIIRLRNEWVPVDPRGWPEMDVEISVGLGVGEKSEMIGQADAVLETLAQLVQSPFASMVKPQNVFNAVKRKLTAAGVKNTDDFISEAQEGEEQPEGPSPEEQRAMAEMQMQQAKMQAEQELQRMRLDLQREEAALKLQLAREQAEAQAQLAREKAEFEAELAAAKMRQEADLARMKMQLEAELSRDRAEEAAEAQEDGGSYEGGGDDADLPDNRPGGDLSE